MSHTRERLVAHRALVHMQDMSRGRLMPCICTLTSRQCSNSNNVHTYNTRLQTAIRTKSLCMMLNRHQGTTSSPKPHHNFVLSISNKLQLRILRASMNKRLMLLTLDQVARPFMALSRCAHLPLWKSSQPLTRLIMSQAHRMTPPTAYMLGVAVCDRHQAVISLLRMTMCVGVLAHGGL